MLTYAVISTSQEMLVNYSSSDSDAETKSTTGGIKRKRQNSKTAASETIPAPPTNIVTPSSLPPLPASFHDLYAVNTRLSIADDPTLHGGRKRAVPHVDGNWPSHVYLEWYPTPTELTKLSTLLSAVQASLDNYLLSQSAISRSNNNSNTTNQALHLNSLLTSTLGTGLPLHISLSAPITLQTEERDDFLKALRASISHISNLTPFTTPLTNLFWAPNEYSTRNFLVLRASRPNNDELNKLLAACNNVAARFGQPLLYAPKTSEPGYGKRQKSNASRRNETSSAPESPAQETPHDYSSNFHFSIAWTLFAPPTSFSDLMHNRAQLLSSQTVEMGAQDSSGDSDARFLVALRDVQGLEPRFESVKVKIGNNIVSVPFIGEGSEGKREGGILGL